MGEKAHNGEDVNETTCNIGNISPMKPQQESERGVVLLLHLMAGQVLRILPSLQRKTSRIKVNKVTIGCVKDDFIQIEFSITFLIRSIALSFEDKPRARGDGHHPHVIECIRNRNFSFFNINWNSFQFEKKWKSYQFSGRNGSLLDDFFNTR